MYDTTIAAKLPGQLESFLGRISPHFHKPVARFIGDMIYGIMVEKDVKLSSIVRALKEKTTPKKVEDRLSRMLSSAGLEAGLHGRGLRKRRTQADPAALQAGVVPVRLPDIPDKLLHMVIVRGFGKKPMMLLTTLAKTTTREALWQVVEGYITRWRVEDTIRHVKQSYNLEDMRLFKYGKIKAMAYPPSEASAVGGSMRGAIVLATTYFSMAWIGNSEKHEVIARSIARMSFRIHEVPEFHFYSIADGASDILKRCRRWRGFDPVEAGRRAEESLFAFFGMNTG